MIANRRHINTLLFVLMGITLVALIAATLFIGSVKIPAMDIISIITGHEASRKAWEVIVLQSRLPMIGTAIVAGAALAVSGLLLQTVFDNPLAGPSILGVSTGSSLGVAIVMLTSLSVLGTGISQHVTIVGGAFIGAMLVLGIILIFSTFVRSSTMLLIVGILVGYLTSSAISLLNFFSTQEGVHSFMIWGLGSFSGVTASQLTVLASVTGISLLGSLLLIKPLNALLLGERYAQNLGVSIKAVRTQLLIITGLLTAGVTAFCGPISFLGLVVPHVARLLFRTSNHIILLPATILCGAIFALLCTLICVMPTTGVLPINAITPIVGVPVILYIILNRKNISYFN